MTPTRRIGVGFQTACSLRLRRRAGAAHTQVRSCHMCCKEDSGACRLNTVQRTCTWPHCATAVKLRRRTQRADRDGCAAVCEPVRGDLHAQCGASWAGHKLCQLGVAVLVLRSQHRRCGGIHVERQDVLVAVLGQGKGRLQGTGAHVRCRSGCFEDWLYRSSSSIQLARHICRTTLCQNSVQLQTGASGTHRALGDDGAVVSEQRQSVLDLQWDGGAAQRVDGTLQQNPLKSRIRKHV